MKWTVSGAVVILISLTLLSWIGSWVFLDKDSQYTETAAALPLFSNTLSSPGSEARLVQIPAGEWTFKARVAGFDNPNPKGNLILLHGFPETSIMWEALITTAANAGYRVVAFDQRGYSPGARPMDRGAYTGEKLVSDVFAVADAAGFEHFNLVGHDWGAVVGWQTVFTAPERIDRFTALSIPHISAIAESFEVEPDLQSRSAYMAFYWLPWLPELSLSADNFKALRDLYADHPDHHTAEYLALFREHGALTSALNWYRGGLSSIVQPSMKVAIPVQFIWGKNDPVTSSLAVDLQHNYMAGPFEITSLDAGHWIMETHTDAVVDAIMTSLD